MWVNLMGTVLSVLFLRIPSKIPIEQGLDEVALDFIKEPRGKKFQATGTTELSVITITSIALVGIKKKGKN